MIDGLATATMVASTRIMKNPINSAHSACHGSASRARVAVVSNSGKVGTEVGEISS